MTDKERAEIRDVIRSLMSAENLGDVREHMEDLCRIIGEPPLEGGFLDRWTKSDWERFGWPEDFEDLDET